MMGMAFIMPKSTDYPVLASQLYFLMSGLIFLCMLTEMLPFFFLLLTPH